MSISQHFFIQISLQCLHDLQFFKPVSHEKYSCGMSPLNKRHGAYSSYHIRGKTTKCWLAETGHFFLNHEGTFGNQEGMITWCWLAERACSLVKALKILVKLILNCPRAQYTWTNYSIQIGRLRAVQFKGNTSAKSVTPMQITHRNSELWFTERQWKIF